MIEIRELPITFSEAVVGVYLHNSNVHLLTVDFFVRYYDLGGSELGSFELVKRDELPTTLYLDDEWLYVGFEDGVVEIRAFDGSFGFFKLTSEEDPGGPGRKAVVQLYSVPNYLFVSTEENGVLIYLKPDFEFFKWIMIGGFTSIQRMSYTNQRLYVLDSERQIHILDFRVSRLLPLNINTKPVVDIAYDGKYLALATAHAVRIYRPKSNYKIVAGYKFDQEIAQLWFQANFLLIQLRNHDIMVLEKSSQFRHHETVTTNLYLSRIKYIPPKSKSSNTNEVNLLTPKGEKLFHIRINYDT